MESAYKLWNRVFTEQHLKTLFENKIRKKASVGLDWITPDRFAEQLDAEVGIIYRKCNIGKYHFTRYREFLISKGSKKPPRCISIPTVRDKLVFAALNEVLTGTYGNDVVTPMPQVIIREIRDTIQEGKFDTFIKIDIQSFYASINHALLNKILRRRIRKHQILELVDQAISTQTLPANAPLEDKKRSVGLPEGLSISNTLANLYMQSIDSMYNQHSTDYKFWRYVDDILLLTTHATSDVIQDNITKHISKLELEIAESKTQLGEITQGFEYLGYFIAPGSISVRKSSVLKMEQSLETVFRNYRASKNKNTDYLKWRINLKVTGFIFEERKYGWVFFYSQIDDLTCLYHLDWYIAKLSNRYNVEKVEFKRFIRAHMEIVKALHTTSYIPNLDKMSITEKRRIVKDIYGQNTEGKDDYYIEQCFHRIMSRELRDIQKDVQAFS